MLQLAGPTRCPAQPRGRDASEKLTLAATVSMGEEGVVLRHQGRIRPAGATAGRCRLRIEQGVRPFEGGSARLADGSRPARSAANWLFARPRSPQHASRRQWLPKAIRRGKATLKGPRKQAGTLQLEGPWRRPGGPFGDRCGTRRFPSPQRLRRKSAGFRVSGALLRLAAGPQAASSSQQAIAGVEQQHQGRQPPGPADIAGIHSKQKSPAAGSGCGRDVPASIKVVPKLPAPRAEAEAYPGHQARQRQRPAGFRHSTCFPSAPQACGPTSGRGGIASAR